MDWSKAAEILAMNSYKRVFGTAAPIEEVAELIEETMSYTGNYPCEVQNPELKRIRLQINNYADNEQLNGYFGAVREIDPDFFHSEAAFDKVFELASILKNGNSAKTEVEEPEEIKIVNDSTTVEDITSTEPADVENKSTIKKENEKMEVNKITELQKQHAQVAAGENLNGAASNAEATARDKQVAKRYMEENNAARIEYSKNAKIVKMYYQAMLRSDLALDGKEAMGTVSKPQAALEAFRKVTGMHTGEDGAVHYSAGIDYAEAEEVRKTIQAAIENPDFKVKPLMDKKDTPAITVKGIKVSYNGKEEMVPQKKIVNLLVSKTIGTLYGPTAQNPEDTLQILMVKAIKRAGSSKKSTSYSIRIANKDSAASDKSLGVLARVIDDNTTQEQRNANFKSAIGVRHRTNRTKMNGDPVYATYHIPLSVPCHKVKIIEEAADLYSSAGVGRAQKATSIDEVIKNSSSFIDVLAEMKVRGALPDEVAEKMSDISEEINRANADAASQMASGPIDASDL